MSLVLHAASESANRSHDVAQFLRAIHAENGNVLPFEIRILKVGQSGETYSGIFDNVESALRSIEAFEKRHSPKAIYCTLNPFDLGKRERTKQDGSKYFASFVVTNRIDRASQSKCVTNADISRRRWLFVDVDPIRPSGVNSSDSQMESAVKMADSIRSDLASDGWPEPIQGMSGNGATLLWRIDLPSDDESKRLIERATKAIAERYSPNATRLKDTLDQRVKAGSYDDAINADSADVDIDKSVHNPARICKILGTPTRKGPHSELRPQRQSWHRIPTGEMGIVSREQLDALAATVAESASKRSESVTNATDIPATCFADEVPASDPVMREIIAETRMTLAKIPASVANHRESWRNIGMALHATHYSLLDDWIHFSKQSSLYKEGECKRMWANFVRGKGITAATLHHYVPKIGSFKKELRKLLKEATDIDEAGIVEMMKQWNKSQNVPVPEDDATKIIRIETDIEKKKRAKEAKRVESDDDDDYVRSWIRSRQMQLFIIDEMPHARYRIEALNTTSRKKYRINLKHDELRNLKRIGDLILANLMIEPHAELPRIESKKWPVVVSALLESRTVEKGNLDASPLRDAAQTIISICLNDAAEIKTGQTPRGATNYDSVIWRDVKNGVLTRYMYAFSDLLTALANPIIDHHGHTSRNHEIDRGLLIQLENLASDGKGMRTERPRHASMNGGRKTFKLIDAAIWSRLCEIGGAVADCPIGKPINDMPSSLMLGGHPPADQSPLELDD
jgi:hypothetical protein